MLHCPFGRQKCMVLREIKGCPGALLSLLSSDYEIFKAILKYAFIYFVFLT